MSQATKSRELFERRKTRTRFQLRKKGGDRVRLSVFRSGKHIYAQLIDDQKGQTVAAASTMDKEIASKLGKGGATIEGATAVGTSIAKKAKAAKVDNVIFDRGGYLFHGRVKAVAEAARENGLKF